MLPCRIYLHGENYNPMAGVIVKVGGASAPPAPLLSLPCSWYIHIENHKYLATIETAGFMNTSNNGLLYRDPSRYQHACYGKPG